METKLTIRIDEEIIKSAKDYAQKNKTSISKIISTYLVSLTGENKSQYPISPIVKEISGIIPEETNTQKLMNEYHSHLQEKYK